MSELVTVAIATYNSAKFVEETLQSIYAQTYPNISLIVSDDFSRDNTVQIVNNWLSLEKNYQRFFSVEVITVPENTGVSSNLNRCLKATPSNWLKYIGGDDILLPNCIEDNMSFISKNPEAKIIFSQVKVYQDSFLSKNYVHTIPEEYPDNIMQSDLTANDQYNLLLLSDRITFTPSSFIDKRIQINVGGFNENNRLVEDYPMWLLLTKSGEKLFYFQKETVGYRIHKNALNNTGENVLFKPSALNSHPIRKQYAHPFLPWERVMSEQHVFAVSVVFQKLGWNKSTYVYNKLYRLFSLHLNPFEYILAVKKRLPKNRHNIFYK